MYRFLPLLLLALPAAAQKDPLAGTFTISGTNLGGEGAYGGTLRIEPTGSTYRLTWESGEPVVGIGLRRGAFLAAAYGDASCGVALYTPGNNGTLVGAWSVMGATETGTEIMAAADESSRRTVMGTNPGTGSLYRGEAAFRPTGSTFHLQWTVGEATYSGTGLRLDDAYAVAFGSPSCGIALYDVRSDGLSGIWTLQGQTTAGTERAVRQ